MFKKIIVAVLSAAFCVIASICLGLYFRSDLSDTFYLPPFFRVMIMIFACVAIYLAARVSAKDLFPHRQAQIIRGALGFAFVLYLLLLVNFLFFETSFLRSHSLIFIQDKAVIKDYLDEYLNVEPFSMIRRYFRGYMIGTVSLEFFLMNIFGNFILFMPFAFFLPVLFEKQRNFIIFFFTVALASASAEVLQVVFMTGTGDVDDLLLNTVGACILFGLLNTKIGKKLVDFVKG